MDKFSYVSSSPFPSPSSSPSPLLLSLLLVLSTLTSLTDGILQGWFFFYVCFCFGFGGNQGRTEIAPYGAELKTEAQASRAPGPGDSCDHTGLALAELSEPGPQGREARLTLRGDFPMSIACSQAAAAPGPHRPGFSISFHLRPGHRGHLHAADEETKLSEAEELADDDMASGWERSPLTLNLTL